MERQQRQVPEIKGYLGYSSGVHSRQDPYGFRSCDTGLQTLLSVLPTLYPALRPFLERQPILISCYPAFLGILQTIPVVDTYLRQDPFSRALLLACAEKRSVIVLGQPLSTAEMLYRHQQVHAIFPSDILIALGGYYCPRSLESFITGLVTDRGSSTAVVHGYGLVEVGVGCLFL